MDTTEKTLRTHIQPLPRTTEDLIALFKRVLSLGFVEEVKVTPKEFAVSRWVEPGDEVLPKTEDINGIDAEFVLTHITNSGGLEVMVLDPNESPYIALVRVTQRISSRRLVPTHVLAPEGPWLGAFLGLDEDEDPPQFVFGMRVLYSASPTFAEKLVVIGGPTTHLSDASCGVILDLGA